MSENSFITLKNLNTVYSSIKGDISQSFKYIGSVATISDLPTATSEVVGHIYTVTAKKTEYVCLPKDTSYEWKPLGSITEDDIDNTPGGTAGSTKLITSGAVNSGLSNLNSTLTTEINKKVNTSDIDTTAGGTSGNNNPISSGAVNSSVTTINSSIASLDTNKANKSATVSNVGYSSYNLTQTINGSTSNILTVDNTVGGTSGSSNPISSNAVNKGLAKTEKLANKVSSISSSSTDEQYPTAKCVYDIIGNVESLLEAML